jgi:hypothetical protein
MNDKDLGAFYKWVEIEFGEIQDHQRAYMHEKSIFRFACEYKQKEIDELIMEKDFHAETLIELKSKIKELETFIRADVISTNWENKGYQEAVHYNWLDDEIRKVEHHNFNLQAENKKLREALEFYGNEKNYWKRRSNSNTFTQIIKDITIHPDGSAYGGRRAREALKEVEE